MSRRLEVIGRVQILSQRGLGLGQHRTAEGPALQDPLGDPGTHRPGIHAAIGEPHVAEHLAVKPRMGRQAGHGEIAATPREFGKTRAIIGPYHWHLDRRQHLARLEVGLVKVTEEVGGRDLAAAALGRDFQLGIEREHAGRQFRRRIGMGEAAANGPTVTDGGVRNPGYCLAEHRCGTCNLHRGLDLRISGERADP